MNIFIGNIMTAEEKQVLQDRMIDELPRIDKELLPYLDKLNSFSFFQTTYSCIGHGDPGFGTGCLHFRSGLTEKETINWILKPLLIKFMNDSEVSLTVYQSNLKYMMGFHNGTCIESIEYLIEILDKVIPDKEYGW